MATHDVLEVAETAPMGRFHYGLLFWCSFIMMFDGYDLVIYGSVVPQLMEQWSLPAVQAGWMGSAAIFGMMFGALTLGPLADRFGRRPVILLAIGLCSLTALGNAFAWDAWSFATLRFITGIGLGGTIPNIVALINDMAPKSRRNLMTTVMLGCYSLGALLSALVALLVLSRFGWEYTFVIAGLPLLAMPWMYRYLPESLPFLVARDKIAATALLRRIHPTIDVEKLRWPTLDTRRGSASVSGLFTEGRAINTLALWIGFGMCLLMVFGLNTWLPKIMVAGGYPLVSGLMFLVTLNLGSIVGALSSGWLADRWGSKPTLMLFLALAVVSLCILGIKPGPLLLNLMLLLAGAATVGSLAVIHAFAAQQYPTDIRSTGISWCSAMGRLGGVAGPALGGLMLSMNLSLQMNFILCSVPGVIALVVVAIVTRRNVEVLSSVQLQDSKA
ncbi:MFS transporter [Pseudomonas fluorescens]|uniref:Gentisate transporter n=1 Tax=Pseudomonas fluorescens TaxID=294 RepID=A0A5E7FAY5_PSEFL|nr:aromatic acid/H+ symport family MFS transporter [Pseudomonas fluorescens]VVO36296.1 Gentisate transporter [Pseudomonas fluorescens]